MSFAQGVLPTRNAGAGFEFSMLTDLEKRDLCVGLLAEFGASRFKETDRGELIHSCCIPNAGHRNGDKNASASLNWKKLTFNCLGCGSQGGILWLIAVCRGLDTPQARDWLGSQTGLGQRSMELPRLLALITQIYGQHHENAPIPRYSPAVLEPWLGWEQPHPYLTDGLGGAIPHRGIPEATIEHFRVGYAPEYFDGSERIIIPLFWRGDLVGWQARCLPGYQGNDKYRNSPDLPRDRVLYNHARRNDLLLVESPMSVLRHYHHMEAMQATFGASVSESQIRLCQRYSSVTLWFDNDKAGWGATRKVGNALSRYAPVLVVNSPYSADAADMPDDLAEEMVDNAIPLTLWNPPSKLKKLEW